MWWAYTNSRQVTWKENISCCAYGTQIYQWELQAPVCHVYLRRFDSPGIIQMNYTMKSRRIHNIEGKTFMLTGMVETCCVPAQLCISLEISVRVVYSWVLESWNSKWKMLKKTSFLRSQAWDNFPEAGTDLRHSHNHWWSHYNCCVPYLSTNMLQGSTCMSSALVLYHSLSVEAKCSLQMSGQKS